MHHIPLDKAWRVHFKPLSGWTGCLLRFCRSGRCSLALISFWAIGLLAIVIGRETQLSPRGIPCLRGLGGGNAPGLCSGIAVLLMAKKMKVTLSDRRVAFHDSILV